MSDDTITHRVLVVDDNRSIHADITKILAPSSTEGLFDAADAEILGLDVPQEEEVVHFEVSSAYQGETGFEEVKKALEEQRPFQLAFVDMRMPPGWDGLETIENIWRIDPDLHAVICTAYSDHSWEQITQRLGRSDRLLILKKPFDSAEVIQIAHALCQKWDIQRKTRLRLNALEKALAHSKTPVARQGYGDVGLAARLIGLIRADAASMSDVLSTRSRVALDTAFGLLNADSESMVVLDANALLDAIIASRNDDGHALGLASSAPANIECAPSRLASILEGVVDVGRIATAESLATSVTLSMRESPSGITIGLNFALDDASREDARRAIIGRSNELTTTIEVEFGGQVSSDDTRGSLDLVVELPRPLTGSDISSCAA